MDRVLVHPVGVTNWTYNFTYRQHCTHASRITSLFTSVVDNKTKRKKEKKESIDQKIPFKFVIKNLVRIAIRDAFSRASFHDDNNNFSLKCKIKCVPKGGIYDIRTLINETKLFQRFDDGVCADLSTFGILTMAKHYASRFYLTTNVSVAEVKVLPRCRRASTTLLTSLAEFASTIFIYENSRERKKGGG